MKRLWIALVLLGVSVGATAQTPTPAPTTGGAKLYVLAIGGDAVARKSGVLFGAQAGYALAPKLELFGEAGRMANVPNPAMNDAAAKVATFLAGLGRGAAETKVKAPANYATLGVRYLFGSNSRYTPYASVSVGGATVEKKPEFSLNGVDITDSMATYGVALGQDLTGKKTRLLATGGFGVRIGLGSLIADLSVQYRRIFTKEQGTNIAAFVAGLGYRF